MTFYFNNQQAQSSTISYSAELWISLGTARGSRHNVELYLKKVIQISQESKSHLIAFPAHYIQFWNCMDTVAKWGTTKLIGL